MKIDTPITIGWREWVALPDLGLNRIKAKIDTGARTSALHAFRLATHHVDGHLWVAFAIHPKQRRHDLEVECEAPVFDQRIVSDSGGHKEERYVIRTTITLGHFQWPIEMTLTDRDDMRFRMLLGRSAMKDRLIVDPSQSYLARKPRKHLR